MDYYSYQFVTAVGRQVPSAIGKRLLTPGFLLTFDSHEAHAYFRCVSFISVYFRLERGLRQVAKTCCEYPGGLIRL
jgi:hypothetical protein